MQILVDANQGSSVKFPACQQRSPIFSSFVRPWKASLGGLRDGEEPGTCACVCTEVRPMLPRNPHNCSAFHHPRCGQHEPSWLNFIVALSFFQIAEKTPWKQIFVPTPSDPSSSPNYCLHAGAWGEGHLSSDKAIKRSLKWINHGTFQLLYWGLSKMEWEDRINRITKPKPSREPSSNFFHIMYDVSNRFIFLLASSNEITRQVFSLLCSSLLHLKSRTMRDGEKGFFFFRGSIDKHEEANPWWWLDVTMWARIQS